MRKVWVVAGAELGQAVRSKAFIVSLILMPVLFGGSILVQKLVGDHVDTTPRAVAVLDESGQLCEPLRARTEARNTLLAGKVAPFTVECVPASAGDAETLRLALSDRIRKGELFAFAEIPASALDGDGETVPPVAYYSDEPSYRDLVVWLGLALSDEARAQRFRRIGADPALIAKLGRGLEVQASGLYTRAADGSARPAARIDKVRTFVVPIVLMFLVFMVVMTSAPQLLNSVLEEKMSRISEVLLGSITPFELMLGKLLGSAGVSLILAAIYIAGGLGAAVYFGYGDVVPLSLWPWLALYLVLAIFFYGSLYIAVGAACSELKDAQSLMMPVMLLSIMPVMVWKVVLDAPNSGTATALSLFPPATPFLMLLRMALHPGPPLWQAALSVLLTGAATVGCVWAAGRIFRVGVLVQGKAPSIATMIRWVFTK